MHSYLRQDESASILNACGAGSPSSGSSRCYTTTLMTYQLFTHILETTIKTISPCVVQNSPQHPSRQGPDPLVPSTAPKRSPKPAPVYYSLLTSPPDLKLREIQFLFCSVQTFSSVIVQAYQIFVCPRVFLPRPIHSFGQQLGRKNNACCHYQLHECQKCYFQTVNSYLK